jgi:hypothetical protein
MKGINWSYATKAIVSLLGNATLIIQQYPHVSWQQAATAGITTILVWLAPNTSSPTQKVE